MIDCTDLHIRQSQAPVSINSCLTIEGLLKKCISEEVPWLFSSNGYHEQRKFMRIEAEKKRSCLASMGRFISVFEVSKRTNPE